MLFYYLSGMWFFFMSMIFMLISLLFLLMKFNIFLEWNLLLLNSVSMNMFIFLDWISLMFMFLVLMISSMIMFYCIEYMSHDINKVRFFYLVFLFIISMILMVLSPNMVSIILGWDGLGLVSYCLVIFYQNYFSFNSGMLTVLMNRIGDIMTMISILLFFHYGSWNFMNLNCWSFYLLLCVMLAAFTKSAQFPFSSWLPAAMAAPTPVSSLVHSSTLVTAGVYLLIRFNYLMYKSELIMIMLIMFGMITMLLAGMSAIFEYDLKKIIAFSTLSQLGLMMVIYGMKFFLLSYFHLLIHAMFKSMMFMCSGVIIHMMNNVQDIRFLGNLMNFMPFTLLTMLVSNFSLCGLPFMSGFYSKDMILEKVFMNKFNLILYIFIILSTMMTVIYSFRLLYYLMNKNFYFFPIFKIVDLKIMNFSMLILLLNSIFSGFIFNWLIFNYIEEIYLLFFEKILIIVICLISLMIVLYIFNLKFSLNSFYKFFMGKMWLLYNMNFLIVYFNLKFMNKYLFIFDKGWNEVLINSYISYLINFLSFKVNFNYLYIIFMILFYMIFILIVVL
uniref:NADH-ubiquinone oxidoreductase chain 5 n=1 Tax=Metaphycus eriococci TaxID=2498640 RepID=A0A7T3U6T5_9HYME|nr:NADH dehydrogenase subunit 5 [Metaphycus eriococci]QPZ53230.1 NADH dehydrogenase subunit 5 [Metaphycus eriococci]